MVPILIRDFCYLLFLRHAPFDYRIPDTDTHSVAPLNTEYKLVGVFRVDMLASHLLEKAACAVGDLLVLVAAQGVSGLRLHEIESCQKQRGGAS